ncbi:MAG: replication restart helicase PriA [Longimicrobiales bacterium]
MRAKSALVAVALPLPLRQTFTYGLEGTVPSPGTRVMVPFRNGVEVGWILGPGTQVPKVRGVLTVLDDRPSITPDLLTLAEWIAKYYVAPLGQVLKAMLPAPMVDRSRDMLVPLRARRPEDVLTEREAQVLAYVGTRPGGVSSVGVRRSVGKGPLWPPIRSLEAKGLLGHVTVPPKDAKPRTRRMISLSRQIGTLEELDQVFGSARRQREAYELVVSSGGDVPLSALLEGGFSRSVVAGMVDKGVVHVGVEEVSRDPFQGRPQKEQPKLTPTPDQAGVTSRLLGGLGTGKTFLLHGVTGSGKTLVYVNVLRQVLEQGQGGIVLVPEIALTPQTVERFRAAFGDLIAVLHSGLSGGERFDAWRALRDGSKRIAIGARSAVFAPVRDLGVVLVDEEHDGSYKQSEAPRYNARDVGVVRAQKAGALCVLGSATPSLESWSNARSGKYELLSLPDRVGGGVLPEVHVVDLRKTSSGDARVSASGGHSGTDSMSDPMSDKILSGPLRKALGQRLDRGEQAVILLNRRGYAAFSLCQDCGGVMTCIHCSVSMTYHRGRRTMVCHHCGHQEAPPTRCTACGSDRLSLKGLGTEQVERVTQEVFPEARIARMDVDTTGGKWAHQEILDRVGNGSVDILLGTQMIAKGLDFPNVTLVGVINADVGLHMPDFRATERTFQLLAQVAGRAGRGALSGEVIIQTYVPEHYAIRAAVGHDYLGFVQRELKVRADPAYPPHVRMARVVVSSPVQVDALAAGEGLGDWLKARLPPGVSLLGPAPAPIERLHGRYRWHVLLRGSPGPMGEVLTALASGFRPRGSDVRTSIDRDPIHLM